MFLQELHCFIRLKLTGNENGDDFGYSVAECWFNFRKFDFMEHSECVMGQSILAETSSLQVDLLNPNPLQNIPQATAEVLLTTRRGRAEQLEKISNPSYQKRKPEEADENAS